MSEDARIDALLAMLDRETRETRHGYERALFCLLTEYKNCLPPLDERFHKSFRQCDCTNSGHIDAAIWLLLDSSDIFWECFAKVTAKDVESSDELEAKL